jgi:peptidoglycan/LPS O-acetylase OafA/YrhL
MFGLRFLCMFWTLIGHSFYLAQSFISNIDEFREDLNNSFWNVWITNFTLGVDVFFTLSGILLGYSWFKRWNSTKNKTAPDFSSVRYWMTFYRHRLIRLWPAYLYALIQLSTRLSYTYWHPVFSPTDPAVQCPKHWYKNVLMLSSVFESVCMPWSWYVSAEFIFYILSPIFLITLYKSRFVGISLIISTISISCFSNLITIFFK